MCLQPVCPVNTALKYLTACVMCCGMFACCFKGTTTTAKSRARVRVRTLRQAMTCRSWLLVLLAFPGGRNLSQ